MDLKKYFVRNKLWIRTKKGLEMTGTVCQYCYPEDNDESNKESLIIDADDGNLYNLFDDDIEEIKILE
ncbi:hypothetical protein [Dubosiella muris]|uniref:Uncharacterized protein n=1 Tax=Dubosiella muris TaxID=3038133 RepID=A0AC61R7Y0_9FIRM|nr:hypothetical protein [Dubosiella muris]TGY66267.1 hypothetical protein E5336_05315 [Dubosiella muris]